MHLQFPLVPLPSFIESWQNANHYLGIVSCLLFLFIGLKILLGNIRNANKGWAIAGFTFEGVAIAWAILGFYLPALAIVTLIGYAIYMAIVTNIGAIKDKKS